MMATVIPMLMNDCTANQIAIPDATSMPNWSSALAAIRSARTSTTASRQMITTVPAKPSSSPATAKMKSVCCSGTKLPAISWPWKSPRPKKAARANGDLRLSSAVAGAARISGWVQERRQAADLVGLEQMQVDHREGGQCSPGHEGGQPAQPDARDRDQAGQQGHHQHDDAQVGLGHDATDRSAE